MKQWLIIVLPVAMAVVVILHARSRFQHHADWWNERWRQEVAEFKRHREDDGGKHLEKSVESMQWSSVYRDLAQVCDLIAFLGCAVLYALIGPVKALRASVERIAALERELQGRRDNAYADTGSAR